MKKHPLLRQASLLWNMVFILTMLVYAVGLVVDIMEPDAAVYAEVSMEMHDSGNFLSIFHKQLDWLDKPHFPFWMSAISYKLFGVSTFAYKLPAVIFILLAAFYTFLFGKKFYSSLHGYLAALLLITAQHIIISNQDVRAEPFMTGLVIMSMYHFGCYLSPDTKLKKTNVWLHAVLGSLALACLMMTKGLFTIIPVAAGIGLALLYERKWKTILNWRWLVIVVIVFAFLFPALYGYYLQFDLHPEKEIFGQFGVSGVEFFLWTSQWGRFTNSGPIKGSGDLSFFVHTLLWAFLPWAFAAFFSLYQKTKQLIQKKSKKENFTYFGFITLFLIFSISKFQLSFYLNPLFPFLSILTIAALLDSGIKTLKIFSVIHTVLCFLMILALGLLHYFFLNRWPHWDTLLILIAAGGLGFYLLAQSRVYLKKIVFATALILLAVNYYVNRDFYPALLDYQAESQVAYYVKQHHLPADQLVFVGEVQSVADIILHHVTPVVPFDQVSMKKLTNKYVFTSPEGKNRIDSLGLNYSVITILQDFPVTRLTGTFINRKTRTTAIQFRFLLKTGT